MKKILLTILLFTLPSVSFGAQTFGAATSDRVNVASKSCIDNLTSFTWAQWFYLTTITTGGRALISKGTAGTATAKRMNLNINGGIGWAVARATTQAVATAANSSFTTGVWYFIVATYDETNGPKLYAGTRTTPIKEVTYASAPTVGTGNTVNDSGVDMFIGNISTTNASHIGRIAWTGVWNRVLTLNEMKQLQNRPQVTSGNVLFQPLYSGIAPDYSGCKNTSTITGTTGGAHVPLPNFFGK